MCQALSLNLDGDLCLNIQLQRAHKQATRATTKKKTEKKKKKESARSLFFFMLETFAGCRTTTTMIKCSQKIRATLINSREADGSFCYHQPITRVLSSTGGLLSLRTKGPDGVCKHVFHKCEEVTKEEQPQRGPT